MSEMNYKTLLSLVLVVVVSMVVIIVFTQFLPGTTDTVQVIQSYTVNRLSNKAIPCLLNCYTSIDGDLEFALRGSTYISNGRSNLLPNYFNCNNEISTIASMIYQLSTWKRITDPSSSIPLERYTTGDFYERAFNILYNCLKNKNCDNDRYMNFKSFCVLDDRLTYYGYIDCMSEFSLNDYLNPGRLKYSNRLGLDIENDFICDEKIGDYYLGPYDVCNYETENKYNTACRPSWAVLKDQQFTMKGYPLSLGRCEDFALLYKTLFRAIDVKEEDMTITMGYCELPPPCKELVKRCDNINYETINCVVPAGLTIKNKGYIEGCSDEIFEAPDEYYGDFKAKLTVPVLLGEDEIYYFDITQPFEGEHVSAYYRNLSFDSTVSNDQRWVLYKTPTNTETLIETNQLVSNNQIKINNQGLTLPLVKILNNNEAASIDCYQKTTSNAVEHCLNNLNYNLEFEYPINLGIKLRTTRISCCDSQGNCEFPLNITLSLGISGMDLSNKPYDKRTDFTIFADEEVFLNIKDLTALGSFKPYIKAVIPIGTLTNPTCQAQISIIDLGMIINSLEYKKTINELKTECSAFVDESVKFTSAGNEPISFNDLINKATCK